MDPQLKSLKILAALKDKLQQVEQKNSQLTQMKRGKYNTLVTKLTRKSQGWSTSQRHLEELLAQYRNSLDINAKSNKCSILQLTEYLRMEKHLSSQVFSYLQGIETEETAKYHNLIRDNQYNQILAELTYVRIVDEIEYVKSNVMSGNTFMYQAGIQHNAVSIEDISRQLQELNRIIQLNGHCKISCPAQIGQVINNQYKRQKGVYDLMSMQIKAIADETSVYKQFKLEFPLKQTLPDMSTLTRKRVLPTPFSVFDLESLQHSYGYEGKQIQKVYQQIQDIRGVLKPRQLDR